MAIRTRGALLLAHGTVSDLDEIPAFLARIRHGRPPPAELVAETRRRYELIGRSPLLEVTQEQAAKLESRIGLPVLVGMRLSDPSVESALGHAISLGLERLAVVPLAPFSVHVYGAHAERVASALREGGARVPELTIAPPWGTHQALVRAHAQTIQPYLKEGTLLILTAHSLPLAVIRGGDAYQGQVEASARAVGAALGVEFELAYQSQGFDGGEWLGPSLLGNLERARERGVRRVAVAPFGFLGEHVETLYDLDIEARAKADALGLELVRVPALGAAPGLIDALEDLVGRCLS
jgi:protoporphyrin/coproporphyrin ferrochelatase